MKNNVTWAGPVGVVTRGSVISAAMSRTVEPMGSWMSDGI
jgi:hypothetical protein